MLRHPASYRDSDFWRAAEERGWELRRVRGSHHIYGKAGWPVILTIPEGVSRNGTKRGIVRSLQEEEQRD